LPVRPSQLGWGRMKVYHASRAAQAILRGGFSDAEGSYGTGNTHRGIWVSDRQLLAGEGGVLGDEPVLELEVPDAAIVEYEWVQEHNFGYREFLVPAEVLNAFGQPRLLP
jgi:hypothetical protein